jgi:hypothetical protein
MKNTICAILFCCAFTSTHAQNTQETIERYFYTQGVKTLAVLAHPTNTYLNGTYRVENNTTYISIYYEDGIYTKLKVKKGILFFLNIEVLDNNDIISPFTAIEFLKDAILELIKDDPEMERNKTDFERKFDKRLEDMNGIELACLCLSLDWLSFPSN